MTIPLQFASVYDGREIFVWSSCLLDLGTDCLLSDMRWAGGTVGYKKRGEVRSVTVVVGYRQTYK